MNEPKHQKLVLTTAERDSPLWKRIEAEVERRLTSHRTKNDNSQGIEDTAKIRGRIAECKELLKLGEEQAFVDQ